MDKSLFIFILIGVGFLYFITNFVGDIQGGVAVIIGRVRFAYTHILRTKEFDGQDHADQFGAFSISMRF